jgi:hypothetical protein
VLEAGKGSEASVMAVTAADKAQAVHDAPHLLV